MELTKEWRPHRRATTEPDFLRRVTAAYRGHIPVLDALWWVEHPSLPSPDGHPSPEARSRELQRVVFSRQNDGGHPLESEELAHLEHLLVEERRAIRDAIMAAWADDDSRTAVESGDADVGVPVAVQAHGVSAALMQPPPLGRAIRRPACAVVILGALVLGLFAGYSGLLDTAAEPRAGSEVSFVGVATGGIGENFGRGPIGAFAIFDGPQRFSDRLVMTSVREAMPPVPSDTIQLDTVRFLAAVGPRRVYAARDVHGRVCLLAVSRDAEQISAACLTEQDFPASGMTLSFADTVDHGGESSIMTITDGEPVEAARAFYTVRWTVDGSLLTRFEALTSRVLG